MEQEAEGAAELGAGLSCGVRGRGPRTLEGGAGLRTVWRWAWRRVVGGVDLQRRTAVRGPRGESQAFYDFGRVVGGRWCGS